MPETIKLLLTAVLGGMFALAVVFFYFISSINTVSVEQWRGEDAKAVCEWVVLMDNNIIAGLECTW